MHEVDCNAVADWIAACISHGNVHATSYQLLAPNMEAIFTGMAAHLNGETLDGTHSLPPGRYIHTISLESNSSDPKTNPSKHTCLSKRSLEFQYAVSFNRATQI